VIGMHCIQNFDDRRVGIKFRVNVARATLTHAYATRRFKCKLSGGIKLIYKVLRPQTSLKFKRKSQRCEWNTYADICIPTYIFIGYI